jgi:hypothetical protein
MQTAIRTVSGLRDQQSGWWCGVGCHTPKIIDRQRCRGPGLQAELGVFGPEHGIVKLVVLVFVLETQILAFGCCKGTELQIEILIVCYQIAKLCILCRNKRAPVSLRASQAKRNATAIHLTYQSCSAKQVHAAQRNTTQRTLGSVWWFQQQRSLVRITNLLDFWIWPSPAMSMMVVSEPTSLRTLRFHMPTTYRQPLVGWQETPLRAAFRVDLIV